MIAAVRGHTASRWLWQVLGLWLLVAPALVAQEAPPDQESAPQQQEEEQRGSQGFRFVFRRRPSLRFGNWLRVDFRVKVQNDVRGFSPDLRTDEGEFELHRARVGVEGRFLRHFEYEVEREIKEEISRLFRIQPESAAHPWRDVFVNFRYFRDFRIRAGKFKAPFSMDQLTGPTRLDFPFRSLIANELAPARELGIAAHGRFFRRGLNYEVGLFKNDGENAEFTEVVDELGNRTRFRTGQRTFAGRVTGTPLRLLPVPSVLDSLELGLAVASTTVPEGLKGLRGRTVSKETFFSHHFVHGQRLRVGTELRWTPGPFSLKGEFIHVRDERRGQGIRGDDLPDLLSRGWYLSGTWVVTGQKYDERDEPRKEFLSGRGLGAVELATRYEQLRFGSSEHPGRPSRSTRAANVLGNSDRVWTFGVNWYLNRFTKIQANAIREKIEDTQRSPIAGRERFWIRLVRIQFVM